MTSPWLRRAFGLCTSVAGTLGVLILVLVMNDLDRGPPEPPPKKTVAFDVPKTNKKPPARKTRPQKPPPKSPKTPPPPIPTLSSAVGGLDLGLFGPGAIDLSEGASALLGNAGDVVMTADSVDGLPVPTSQSAVPYPAQARARGITGHVTLSLSFDARGALTDVQVVDAQPPGVFEDAATKTVRMWRFQPATYQGAPVPVSGVEITLDFDLER